MKLDRQVTIQADRVTAASTQAVVDAKREAELLLTDAGTWIEQRMKAAGAAAAELMLLELQRETLMAQNARRAMVRVAWLTSATSLIVLSGACGLALATFR